MKKLLHYIPFLIILCTTILLFIRVNQDEKHAGENMFSDSPMLGKQMPDMKLETIEPEIGFIQAGTFEGRYTVVNMFASWCVACLAEHKLFSTLKGSKGLNIIGIAWRDKEEDTKAWLEKYGNPYNVVASDRQGKYGILIGVTGIPESFVVDPKGKIIRHIRGTVTEEDIKEIKEYGDKK